MKNEEIQLRYKHKNKGLDRTHKGESEAFERIINNQTNGSKILLYILYNFS